MKSTVSNASTKALVEFCDSLAIDLRRLMPREHLDPSLLGNSDPRHPAEPMFRLWDLAQKETKDPMIGLHVAERVSFGAYKELDFVIMTSSSFKDALHKWIRYLQVANAGVELQLRQRGPEAQIVLHNPIAPRNHLRRSIEYTFALLLLRSRFSSRVAWKPKEVHFTFSPPESCAEYYRVFGAPVRFNQPGNQLILDESMLRLPHPHADPALCEILDHRAQRLISRPPAQDEFVNDVKGVLRASLPHGTPKISSIAKRLAMSDRSFQRRLTCSGTSFRVLLDTTRHELALTFLHEPKIELREVSFLLGFSHPRAFYRAFIRWTGKTPDQYRNLTRPT